MGGFAVLNLVYYEMSGFMTEIEAKSFLTKYEFYRVYKRLLNHKSLKKSCNAVQINYYFDTVDFLLYNCGNTLRIRQIENNLVLQYKYNKKQIKNNRISDEYQKDVSMLPKSIYDIGICDEYVTGENEFLYVGNLITNRFEFQVDRYSYFLDINYYWGNIIVARLSRQKNQAKLMNQILPLTSCLTTA